MQRDTALGILGGAIVVGFFMPWIDVGGHVQASGWELLRADGLGWAHRIALALCPVAGVALALAGLARLGSAAAIATATGAAILGYTVYDLARSFIHVTGTGLWIVLASAAIALVVGLSARARKSA